MLLAIWIALNYLDCVVLTSESVPNKIDAIFMTRHTIPDIFSKLNQKHKGQFKPNINSWGYYDQDISDTLQYNYKSIWWTEVVKPSKALSTVNLFHKNLADGSTIFPQSTTPKSTVEDVTKSAKRSASKRLQPEIKGKVNNRRVITTKAVKKKKASKQVTQKKRHYYVFKKDDSGLMSIFSNGTNLALDDTAQADGPRVKFQTELVLNEDISISEFDYVIFGNETNIADEDGDPKKRLVVQIKNTKDTGGNFEYGKNFKVIMEVRENDTHAKSFVQKRPIPSRHFPPGQNPSNNFPSDQHPSRYFPPEQNPSQYYPANQNPSQYNPSDQNPSQYNPSRQFPSGQNPSQYNPSDQNPSQYNPSRQFPSGQNPLQYNPSDQNPSQYNPSDQNPSQYNPSRQFPSGQNPSQYNPSDQNPSRQFPSNQYPSKHFPLRDYPPKAPPKMIKDGLFRIDVSNVNQMSYPKKRSKNTHNLYIPVADPLQKGLNASYIFNNPNIPIKNANPAGNPQPGSLNMKINNNTATKNASAYITTTEPITLVHAGAKIILSPYGMELPDTTKHNSLIRHLATERNSLDEYVAGILKTGGTESTTDVPAFGTPSFAMEKERRPVDTRGEKDPEPLDPDDPVAVEEYNILGYLITPEHTTSKPTSAEKGPTTPRLGPLTKDVRDYFNEPIDKLHEISPYVKDCVREMDDMSIGFFTMFLIKLFESLATKNNHDVEYLLGTAEDEVDILLNKEALLPHWGQPFVKTLTEFSSHLTHTEGDVAKGIAVMLHHVLVNRREGITLDFNSVIDYIDKLYTEHEGIELLRVAEKIRDYPKNNITPAKLHRELSAALYRPLARLGDSVQRQILFDSVNQLLTNRLNPPPIQRRSPRPVFIKKKTLITPWTRRSDGKSNINRRIKTITQASTYTKESKRRDRQTYGRIQAVKTNRNVKHTTSLADKNIIEMKRRDVKDNQAFVKKQNLVKKSANKKVYMRYDIKNLDDTTPSKKKELVKSTDRSKKRKAVKNGDSLKVLDKDITSDNTPFVTKNKKPYPKNLQQSTVKETKANKFQPIQKAQILKSKLTNKSTFGLVETSSSDEDTSRSQPIKSLSIPQDTIPQVSKETADDTIIKRSESSSENEKPVKATNKRFKIKSRPNEVSKTKTTDRASETTITRQSEKEAKSSKATIVKTPKAVVSTTASKSSTKSSNTEPVVTITNAVKEPVKTTTTTKQTTQETTTRSAQTQLTPRNPHKHSKLSKHLNSILLLKKAIRHLKRKHPDLYRKYIKHKKRKHKRKRKSHKHNKHKKALRSGVLETEHNIFKEYEDVKRRYEFLLKRYMKENSGTSEATSEEDEGLTIEINDTDEYKFIYDAFKSIEDDTVTLSPIKKVIFSKVVPKIATENNLRMARNKFTILPSKPLKILNRKPSLPKTTKSVTIASKSFNYNKNKFNRYEANLKKIPNSTNDEEIKVKNHVIDIQKSSSYSDEEDSLKFHLNDALRHGNVNFKQLRRFNDMDITKKELIKQFSSYSSEEVVLKSNIYKAVGFHRNGWNFSEILKSKDGNKFRLRSNFKAVNDVSTYTDDENLLKDKLKFAFEVVKR